MLTWLIVVCAAVVVYSVVTLLLSDTSKERIRNRVQDLTAGEGMDDIHAQMIKQKKKERQKKQSGIISKRFSDSLEMSGIKLNANEFLTLWLITTIGPVLVGLLLSMHVIAVAAMSIVGFAIPPFMVYNAKNKKEQLFNKQLSDAMTIMGNCMRAGYSFQQAMESVAKEMQPPISTEFGRVVKEINYGITMETALTNMVNRVNNKDLELLVAAVLTSAQVGANLSDLLDTIAETVTERIRMREEIQVMTAQGRLSGIIIGLLPVFIVIFMMVTNPSYFTDFVMTPIGRILLVAAVFMEIIGFIVINKIVDLKF